jgi:hypothetical protein
VRATRSFSREAQPSAGRVGLGVTTFSIAQGDYIRKLRAIRKIRCNRKSSAIARFCLSSRTMYQRSVPGNVALDARRPWRTILLAAILSKENVHE